MLTLEEEEQAQGLQRELVVVLHLPRDRVPTLPPVQAWREGLLPLEEVRSEFRDIDREHAVLRIAAPPFLPRDRLRGVLIGCLEWVLGEAVTFSIRVLTEFSETLQAAFDVEELWLEKGALANQTVLSLTDEQAAGEIGLLLSDVRTMLSKSLTESVAEAFPLNHYDILSLWTGDVEEKLSATEAFVAQVYTKWKGTPVSATSRALETAPSLLHFLGSRAG